MKNTIRFETWFKASLFGIFIILLCYFGYVTHEQFFIYSCGSDYDYSSLQFDNLDKITLQPGNNYPYSFTIVSDSNCGNASEIYLLTLVRSATKNFIKRQAIRQTWGRESNSKNRKIFFLLGYNGETQDRLVYETREYKDIIQGSFIDRHWNNPLKMEMAFGWISEYCSNAKYSLFADDDMYVNIPNALKYLYSVEEEQIENLYGGYLFERPVPVRFYPLIHYVSKQEYPFHCYPPFVAGCTIFFSNDVIQKIKKVMPFIPRFHADDKYIGMITQKLGITTTKLNDLIGMRHIGPNGRWFPCLISDHGYTTLEMFQSAFEASYSYCDPAKVLKNDIF